MALIGYPDLDRIDAKNREAIDRFAREHGRPTLLRMMLAYSPPAQEAMNDLYHPVMQNGRLSRRLKESLLVAASDARECKYCAGGHSLFLVNEFGYDQDAVRKMRSGGQDDGWTDAETALVRVHLEDDLGTPEFTGYF
jgi:alkylhydroperoxidase family enzyme